MGQLPENLLAILESDLRFLSGETRRAEGFTGWLTGPDHMAVKEAAERAVLKLRSLAADLDPPASVAASKVPLFFADAKLTSNLACLEEYPLATCELCAGHLATLPSGSGVQKPQACQHLSRQHSKTLCAWSHV